MSQRHVAIISRFIHVAIRSNRGREIKQTCTRRDTEINPNHYYHPFVTDTVVPPFLVRHHMYRYPSMTCY